MQYAIAHLDPNEDNPSMEENPCINVDFENEEESCLEAATMMMDEGYKMVTPFFIEDGGKAGIPRDVLFSVLPRTTPSYTGSVR